MVALYESWWQMQRPYAKSVAIAHGRSKQENPLLDASLQKMFLPFRLQVITEAMHADEVVN